MQKNLKKIAFLLIVSLLAGIMPVPAVAAPGDSPVINTLTPDQGPWSGGTQVTISGSNFVVDSVNTAVYFGGITAQIISITPNTIIITAPSYPVKGTIDVQVVNPDGKSATKLSAFTYHSNPQITGVTPSEGSTVGGTQIKIAGSEFQAGAKVFIGGNEAANLTVTTNEITATVPRNPSVGTVEVRVKNPDGGENGSGSFNYRLSTPQIASITPTKGNKGSRVTIQGTVDSEFDQYTKVKFGPNYGTNVQVTGTTITVDAPDGTGTVDVSVINPDGAESVENINFQYVILPEISSITPNSGKEGDPVQINGLNFSKFSDLEILFGSEKATINGKTDTSLSVTVPGNNTGSVNVTVRSAGDHELSGLALNGFTYKTQTSKPVVSVITPNTGGPEGGTEILIEGSDFLVSAQGVKPTVLIGGKAATNVTVLSTVYLQAVTPPGTVGKKDVQVINWDGGKSDPLNNGFEYRQTIGITAVTPSKGSVEGGTPVIISGYNFPVNDLEAEVTVFIGGNAVDPGQLTVLDSKTIEIRTPVGWIAPGDASGTAHDVTVIVSKAGVVEKAVKTGGFTYVYPESNPQLTGIVNPVSGDATGPRAGGVQVYVYADDVRNGAEIYFGPIKDNRKLSITKIEKIDSGIGFKVSGFLPEVPVAGPYDVILVNPDGAVSILENGFAFKGTTMVVTSITPDFGPVSGGTVVRIVGANFNEGNEKPAVFFASEDGVRYQSPPETVEVSSDGTLIIAKTPAHTPGPKKVIVKNKFGETSNSVYFTFELPQYQPYIDRVVITDANGNESPARGPVTGGTEITIFGYNFATGAEILIDGEPAASVVVHAYDRITAQVPAGTPGAKDVTVNNPQPGGGTYTLPGGYFYYSNPVINKVSPNQASTLGGNIITITGEQFFAGLQVVVGEVYAVESKVVDSTTIKVRVPAGTAGKTGLKVINTDGGTALWDDFTYKTPKGSITVDQLLPEVGPDTGGTPVVITGDGFAPDAIVYFGWEPAKSVQVIGPKEIRVVTPANPAGKYDVTVTNSDDTATTVKTDGFEYKKPLTAPQITGIFPNIGPAAGGTKFRITGKEFWPGATVYIGSQPALSVEVLDNQTIRAVTYGGELGSQDVRVFNPDGGMAYLKGGFTYKFPDSKPVITGVSPNKVITTGGTRVAITGSDFREGVKVFFDNLAGTDVEIDDTGSTIWVDTPGHAPGKVDLTVLNEDGGVAQLEQGLEYALPESWPEIESITPNSGNLEGGTLVTIVGKDFRAPSEVFFGEEPATQVTVVNYKTITAVTPPGKKGSVNVTIRNSVYLGGFTLRNGFTYKTSLPKIIGVFPNQGTNAGGTTVTITGEDFRVGAVVYIGDKEATVVGEVYSSQITVQTPPSQGVGSKDVKVVNPDKESALLKNGFRYKLPDSSPTITALSPGEGSTDGGLVVTIRGTDFRDDAQVYFGGMEGTEVKVKDSTTILVKTPPHTVGKKHVTVMNEDGGSATLIDGFEYKVPLSAPQISKITPNKGPTIGGTPITITGKDFRDGVQVFIDGVPATDVVKVDYKTITAVTPAGYEGAREVTVVNQDNGIASSPKGFTYIKIDLPVIDNITPDSGPSTGGTQLTITGANFLEGAVVTIGGSRAQGVTLHGKNKLTAVTPAGSLGWQEVKITNPDTGWVIKTNGFLYVRPRSAPDTPGWLDATMKDYETIKLSWSQAEFANYYEIYISTSYDGTYRFLDQTKDLVYYATKLEPDTRYYFKVRAVNELGVSSQTGYDYATTDDDPPSGYGTKTEATKIAVNSGKDNVEIVVPTYKALTNAGHVFDLKPREYAKPVQKISFNGAALADASWDIVVTANSLTLSIDPLSILLPQYWRSSSNRLKDVYSNLYITDLGQREAEKALKLLPKNAKILSGVYSIGWESQDGKNKTAQDLFYDDFALSMEYKASDLPKGKKVDIFVYNESIGQWEAAKAAKDYYYPVLRLDLTKPGKFVLVAW